MAADILIISLIDELLYFLIYKARKNRKRGKSARVCRMRRKLWFVFRLRDECGKDRK